MKAMPATEDTVQPSRKLFLYRPAGHNRRVSKRVVTRIVHVQLG